MARLIGPDESVRLVYLSSGANAGKALAQGLSVPLYADLALTIPADVLSTADAVIPGTPPTLTVDAYSQIPLFKFPDGIHTVYTSINGGPAVDLYDEVGARAAADLAVESASRVAGDAASVVTAAGDATAKADAAQAAAVQRANHTGTQSADTLTDGTTAKSFLATEQAKLAGIATAATANAADAALRDRTTHTGVQATSTVTGLDAALAASTGAAAGLAIVLGGI